MPKVQFHNIIKYCLECNTLLKLNNNRDIKRKKYCSHSCVFKTLQKKCEYIKDNLVIGRTKEIRKKAGKTMSRKMKLGLIPKPPSLSMEMRKKIGLKFRGENHWAWIKDRSKLKKRRYNCSERNFLESLRKDIFERDDYTCQITDKKGEKLEVHHIENWSSNIEKRCDKENMITLNKKIHKLFHKFYGNTNNNINQLYDFVTRGGFYAYG